MSTVLLIPQDGTLMLGPSATATDVSCQVSNASITATPNQKTITTLCGITNAAGITAFQLHVEAAQDWSAEGISTFLFENDGQVVEFTLTPTATASPTATGTCYVSPGDFSGASGEIATLTVDLGIVGKPTITPAAAAHRGAAKPSTPEQVSTSGDLAAFAAQLRGPLRRRALDAACTALVDAVEDAARKATGDLTLTGQRARLGTRVVQTGTGATVKATGPWALVERPRRGGYPIRPKSKGGALQVGRAMWRASAVGGPITAPLRPFTKGTEAGRAPAVEAVAGLVDEAVRRA